MTTLVQSAYDARSLSHCSAARKRADSWRLRANQRRFELRIDAEVKESLQSLYKELCETPIYAAAGVGERRTTIYVRVNYPDDRDEPLRGLYWWKPGARCRAVVRHLSLFLKNRGYKVIELEPTVLHAPVLKQVLGKDYHPAMTCMHVVPIVLSW